MPIDSPAVNAPALTATARPVTAKVAVVAYPLLCGKPRGALVVTFPGAVELPHAIAAGTVRVNGQAAAKVAVHGHDVTVSIPPATGITCQSIALGRVMLAFGTGAGLDSAKAGSYAVAVHQGAKRYHATLTVGT
jgi:hypothetical protein